MSQPNTPVARPWTFDTGGPVLHGQVFPAATPRAALLLSHGYAEHAGRYLPLISALTAAGISVYSYDQRGHGQSPGRRSVVDVDVLVADHLRAREALRELDVPLIAFGHSMGGLITAASVLRDPRGLSGVILSSPLLYIETPAPLRAISGVLARIAPNLPLTALESGGLSRLPEEVSTYDNDPHVYRGKIPALSAASMLRVSTSLESQLPDWRLPTFILHGDQDKLADVRGSRHFAAVAGTAHTPRPEIEYLEVEGGYHELYNDTVREEVTARTLDWLDAHLEGR